MVTDGCATGISGLISQGDDWKTARIAAFYSAKLNAAQQNYPVHEVEMFAGIETMLHHVDLLQGARFRWLTDHKGLTHLLNQKNLSGRQARWLEKISAFSFEVVYIPGCDNVVADALSRIYSNDSAGTQRSRSEFTYHDIVNDDTSNVVAVAELMPVLAGVEARVASRRSTRVWHPTEKARQQDQSDEDVQPVVPPRFRSTLYTKQKGGGSVDTTSTPVETGEIIEDQNESIKPFVPDQPDRVENLQTNNTSFLSQSNLGIDLMTELQGKYTDHLILDKPKEFRNFEVKDRLIYLKESGHTVLCIPKTSLQGRSAREIVISEAHSMLTHLGATKPWITSETTFGGKTLYLMSRLIAKVATPAR
jgi:hypothetical protein